MMLVDSHCHLDFPDFADDLDGIVSRAEAAGVGKIVTISTRVRRQQQLLDIAARFPYLETAGLEGGTFCRDDGFINPWDVVAWLVRRCRAGSSRARPARQRGGAGSRVG